MRRAKKQVFVVHGAGAPRLRRGKVYWKPLLEAGLGPGYEVTAPKMPEKSSYAGWKARIEKHLSRLPGRLILAGHSFGASVLLKFLSEKTSEQPISGLFLIATPYWSRRGWQGEYALPRDISKLSQVPRIFLYHSRDDEVVPFAHLARFAKRLPRATVRKLDGHGHEYLDGFPEIVADMKAL